MGLAHFLCAALFFLSAMNLHGADRRILRGHIPLTVTRFNLQPLRELPSTNLLHMAIGLPLRDPDAARAFIEQLYDPTSPLYHQYLTPEEFTEKFGPTVDDYQAVIDFAKANGLRVTSTHPNRLVLDVDGAASDVEKAFLVTLLEYQHPTEARRFYAPSTEPSIPSGLKIVDISGLNNYPRPHPNSHILKAGTRAFGPSPNAGSIPGGQYIGKDFRAAYVPGTTLTGSGQSVALVQFDGYYASDITKYETLAGLSAVTLSNILLDSFSGTPTSDTDAVGEVSLDIEMSISMAPGLARVLLYEGNPNNFIPNDVLSRIANDNTARQISCSWGWSGGPTNSTDNILIQMAAQGQTFFVASGDSCAYPGSSLDDPSQFGTPAVSTYVTSVGGTMLSTSGPVGNWVSETVWNWATEFGSAYDGVGSSGGYSSYYGIPSWQNPVNMANNQGSTTGRNIPDVSLTADHVFVAYFNGLTNWFGGTSCASPLWAGLTALVNQQAAANSKPSVGYLNPALYAIGTGTSYAVCFHDITTGNNEWTGSPSAYSAVAGYDLCTGWGTPNGTNLINALLAAPSVPSLTAYGSTVSGGNGNGVIDADECNSLDFIIANVGGATATAVSATLTSSTPGVTITQTGSAYPNIASGKVATNTTPFQISTSPSFVCGTPVILELVVSFAGGSNTLTFVLPTCTSCPGSQFTGGLSASSPKQTGRLTRSGVASTCSSGKTCPGYYTSSGSYAYQAFSITNTSGSAACITVTLSTSCSGNGSTAIFSESYLGSFNPNSLCSGYLGDIGGSPVGSAEYSFTVPANTNFVVVVSAVNTHSYCSSFTVDVGGLACLVDGGGACAGTAVSASFTGAPTNGTAPLAVTFTDTSTGIITNRFWDFGDSTTTNVTTNVVTHVYAAGTYTVTLIVTGPGGASTDTQPDYVTAVTPPPMAGFAATPTNGTAPLSVTFMDSSTGSISNRFWDFGDTTTTNVTTNVVSHVYAAGAYTVSLIVSGPGGASTNTKPAYITCLTPFQAWQVEYFDSTNNPNATLTADADGTGQNNLFKYVAGLDPTNPASVFLLTVGGLTNQPTQQTLVFQPEVTGRTYTPQFSTDLVNGTWLPLPGYAGPVTNGNQVTITDLNAVESNKFYRIDISLP